MKPTNTARWSCISIADEFDLVRRRMTAERRYTIPAMAEHVTDEPSAARKRQAAEKVVRVLTEPGHTAYFAGGCVRDMLLEVEPKDYDVATDATLSRRMGLRRRSPA